MARIGTEVKFTLPADQIEAGLTAFGLTGGDAGERTIYFVDRLDDAGDPWLFGNGVILRLRRDDADGSVDVTVKLRPAREERLTGRWRPGTRHDADYRVGVGWARERVLSASVEAKREEGLRELLDGRKRDAFTPEQQDFLRRCGPRLEQPMRDLCNAGPIRARRWHDITAGPLRGLRAEQWTWGDGRTFLELSLRCADDDESAGRRALLAAEIDGHGLKPDESTMTKTEAVLRGLL
jgi:hypothetical protein